MTLAYHYNYFTKYGILHRDPQAPHDSSDLHVSRIVQDIVGVEIKRVEKTGNYLMWNGHCWEERDNPTPILDKLADTVQKHFKDINKRISTEKALIVKEFSEWRKIDHLGLKDDDVIERLEALIKTEQEIYKKISSSDRLKILNMALSRQAIRSEDLDNNKDKIVFTNGCYDCVSGEFGANDPCHNATLCIRHDYIEPDEQSQQTWQDYLHSLGFNDETLEYLQRCFGYAATGRGCEKRFWWFRGVTNTSKSTLIELIAKCLDQYAISTLSDQWCHSKKQSGGHTEEIARMRARRMVTADEFEKNSRFNEALLKKSTAGTGIISASRKGEKTIEFSITFALFFSSNYDCRLTEDDEAFIGRLNSLTFKNKIPDHLKDTQFVTKFLSSGMNKMAILKWVMDGAKKYCNSGIGPDPEQVTTSRSELLLEQVSISEQLEEILEKNDKAIGKKAVTLNQILEALTQLQKSTRQHSSFSKREVSSIITDLFGIKLTKSNGHSGFVGLSLKHNISLKPRRGYDAGIDWQGQNNDDGDFGPGPDTYTN